MDQGEKHATPESQQGLSSKPLNVPGLKSNVSSPSHQEWSKRLFSSSGSTGRLLASQRRTSHACERCRLMRTRCSGEPPCTKCTKDGATCAFRDRKRERNKKDLSESKERIHELEKKNAALRRVLDNAVGTLPQSPQSRGGLDGTMSQSNSPRASTSATSSSHSKDQQSLIRRIKQVHGGERHSDNTVGSPGHQDVLVHSVDYGQGEGAAGLVGKRSEISWITRATKYLRTPADAQFDWHNEPEWLSNEKYSYFMDDEDVLSIDEDYVDAFQLPDNMAMTVLSEAFFHACQGIFNFVARDQFLDKVALAMKRPNRLCWEDRRWLALANLIWAIASKWLHMAKLADDDVNIESHLVFYSRARSLGLDHRLQQDHPDARGVQALGLLSLYLMINGSISRAWLVVGIAIRHASSLGLHLKNMDAALSRVDVEERAHTWHSIYSLEVVLSEILGRPTSTSVADTTVPMEPSEDTTHYQSASNEGSTETKAIWEAFLRRNRDVNHRGNSLSIDNVIPTMHHFYHNRLCTISHRIERSFYAPQMNTSWLSVQEGLNDHQAQLWEWEKSLPEELNFWSDVAVDSNPRAKITLALYHKSLEMMLHRTCLRKISIPDESAVSQQFNINSGQACIQAAMTLVDVLPEGPIMHEAVQLLPWWNLLHYLCQAMAVFVLELCLDAIHLDGCPDTLEARILKAMAYLQCLATESKSSYKAWRIFRRLLSYANGRVPKLNIADVPMEMRPPKSWTDGNEVQLLEDLS
ncbi:hypothetical protein EDD36DRAFT_447700 [Exophiala viscosa]|uniref:Zn(2)-C6 fungal-type domain-containing protein n=1 Tax=Exophiala viscosa TaxID=2486360 RepID=A0AAN6I8P1_9EURO|nr:hypothetical protein EDD36DRAFT_447700 [Exophiala viscosa]